MILMVTSKLTGRKSKMPKVIVFIKKIAMAIIRKWQMLLLIRQAIQINPVQSVLSIPTQYVLIRNPEISMFGAIMTRRA